MALTCHLYTKNPLTSDDLSIATNFECLKVFEDESHDKKYLLKCKECEQLYYFCFHEDMDIRGGNDPQYSVFVPIESPTTADKLALLAHTQLDSYSPRIIKDFPSTADSPNIF